MVNELGNTPRDGNELGLGPIEKIPGSTKVAGRITDPYHVGKLSYSYPSDFR
jgi:hypothetical protein